MTCSPKYESQILNYLDDSLPDEIRTQLERHIEHCPECASYLDCQKRLEGGIVSAVADLKLPDEFSSLVLEKIATDQQPDWISEQKRQFEEEFANRSAQLRRVTWTRLKRHWQNVLVPAALGAAFIWLFTTGWVPEVLATSFLGNSLIFSAMLLTVGFVGLGLWCGRQDLRRVLRSVM